MALRTGDAGMGGGPAMRVVIDGLSLNEDRAQIAALEGLLAAWPQTGRDELHVVVPEDRALRVPGDVVVHRVRRGARPFHRRLARAVALPRLCRELRAHAVLDARRSVHVVPLPCPRLSLAGPLTSGLDEGSTWSRAARRLHLSIADQVAVTSWKLRRFKLAPSFFLAGAGADAAAGTAAVVPFAPRPARSASRAGGRSVRWIAAASVSTLALSAAAAASMDLVTSHTPSVTTPAHLNTGTAPINVTKIPTLPSTLTPATSATTPTAVSSTTTPTTPSTSATTSTTTPNASTSLGSGVTSPLTGPTITVPSLPLPITVPSLPLPTISCSTTTSTTSALSILNLCSVGTSVGPPSLQLGSK